MSKSDRNKLAKKHIQLRTPKKRNARATNKNLATTKEDRTKALVLLIFCGSFLVLSAGMAIRAKRATDTAALMPATKTTAGSTQLQLNEVIYDVTGMPGVWVPDTDMQFAMVDLSVTNNGTDTLHFSPISALYLEDEHGEHFEVTSAPNITKGLGGPIAPNEAARGQVGFLVPVNRSYTLHYKINSQQHRLVLPKDTSSN